MFKKLRLKLTIINLSILLALFSLLIIGTYYFSQINMTRHSHAIARRITEDVQSGLITDIEQHHPLPQGPPPGPELGPGIMPGPAPTLIPGPPPGHGMGSNFFFVKASPDGTIALSSSGHYLAVSRLTELTEETARTYGLEGELVFDGIKYSFFKSPLPDHSGLLIVFHNLTQDANILNVQTTTLLIVGLICCLLSFGASFFMANRAMIPIQDAWQQQKNFLSDASHELRTPLAIIQTSLDIVRDNPTETVASQSKWLDNIQEESISMAQLVNSLFFLARADSHQQPLNKQLFSLTTALQQTSVAFESIATAQGVSLQTVVNDSIEIFGDETRIKQAIGILLDNAIKHTGSGGKVVISLLPAAATTLLTVTDSGEGIDPAHLDKIFNRFYQADNSRNKGGAGLGLAIAKWIIESHNGIIAVTSTLGVGTSFTIKLPAYSNEKNL
jgi:two-component system sensor histidine kinase CiaH